MCYIDGMLLDHQLVPEAAAKPRSFVGLMSLYESNFLRLLNIVPELERLDGCFQSSVAGDCTLHVEILERCRYTVTLSLTYLFIDGEKKVADPDLVVRAYLDGQLAEVMNLNSEHSHLEFRRITRMQSHEIDSRWQTNTVLNKWLEYLIDQGHLVLER